MQNFSTIRLIVRGASQKNLRGGGINPPPARARANLRVIGPTRWRSSGYVVRGRLKLQVIGLTRWRSSGLGMEGGLNDRDYDL